MTLFDLPTETKQPSWPPAISAPILTGLRLTGGGVERRKTAPWMAEEKPVLLLLNESVLVGVATYAHGHVVVVVQVVMP